MRGPLPDTRNKPLGRAETGQPGRELLPGWARLERPVPLPLTEKRGMRRGEVSVEMTSPTAADSGTEIRGTGVASTTTAGRATAVMSSAITGKAAGAVRGETAVSPMTAAAIRAGARGETATSRMTAATKERVVQAGAMESLVTGGSRDPAGRAHLGAVTTPARPLGRIAHGRMTGTGTAVSDRAAAQQGLPAPVLTRPLPGTQVPALGRIACPLPLSP